MVCRVRFFFFSSRRRHTRCSRDWSSDVCSSDLSGGGTYFLRRKKLNGGQRSRCAGESMFPHPTTRGGKATNSASELPCPSRRPRSFGLQPPLRPKRFASGSAGLRSGCNPNEKQLSN